MVLIKRPTIKRQPNIFADCQCVADEIKLLTPSELRERDVFLSRIAGRGTVTRPEISARYSISTERVRQIEQKLVVTLSESLILQSPHLRWIKAAIGASFRMGEQMTISAWKTEMERKDVLGVFKADDHDLCTMPVWERLVFLLRAALDRRRHVADVLGMQAGLVSAIKNLRMYDQTSPLAITTIPPEKRKMAARLINGAGAAAIDQLSAIFDDEHHAREYLAAFGFCEVFPGWFSFGDPERYSKSAIYNACKKILAVCSDVGVEDLHAGVAKVAGHKATIPPIEPFMGFLTHLGCYIDQAGVVRSLNGLTRNVQINRAEAAFLEALKTIGPVLSIYDMADYFRDYHELSASSVMNVLLEWSPLPEKIKATEVRIEARKGPKYSLYKLRGQRVSEEEILASVKRNYCSGSDPNLELHPRGGSYYITVGKYAFLTGVIDGSKLTNFAGIWQVLLPDGTPVGSLDVAPPYISGAGLILEAFDLSAGDRIKLMFDLTCQTVVPEVMSRNSRKPDDFIDAK